MKYVTGDTRAREARGGVLIELNKVIQGDALEVMREMPSGTFDSIVTDPPYGLEFMGRDWDSFKPSTARGAGGSFAEGGFKTGNGYSKRKTPSYGKRWVNKRCTKCGHLQSGGSPCKCESPEYIIEIEQGTPMSSIGFYEFSYQWAVEALRVAKPGAHLLAFGGTRTHHRLMCAIEDAGWEIRDCIMWLHAQGFPKSMDVSKQIDKAAGAEREVVGEKLLWGHNAGSGAGSFSKNQYEGQTGIKRTEPITAPATDAAKQWHGWGTALKPAYEIIIMARKPIVGTVAANVLEYGTGGLNIDGCRIGASGGTKRSHQAPFQRVGVPGEVHATRGYRTGHEIIELEGEGRWPANLLLDEESAALLDRQSGVLESGKPAGVKAGGQKNAYGYFEGGIPVTGFGDKGGASRFFYCAKASPGERDDGLSGFPTSRVPRAEGNTRPSRKDGPITEYDKKWETQARNTHPTVKPLDLMRYLCRLVTPPGGIVLDMFAGSGSTLLAARREGFDFVGIEINPEYVAIANERLHRGCKTLDSFSEAPV